MNELDLLYDRSPILAIVPAYNEEDSIAEVVRDINKHGIQDVLVIDDGSIDNTALIARRAGADVLNLPFNLGIGGAVQAGLKYADKGGYHSVIRLDGDGQHIIEEAGSLLQEVNDGKADVVIGSRFNPGNHTYEPPLSRRIGIRWFAVMISFITRRPAYDATSGMQALNRKAIRILARNYPQDYPEVEARVLLHKANLRVIEVPIKMKPRTTGVSSINYPRAIYYMFKVSLATFLAALRRPPRLIKEET